MKKITKILTIAIISILFITKVKAVTNFTPQTNTPLQNCLNSGVCIDESDFWNNMLSYNNLIQQDNDFDYYTIYYDYGVNKLWYIRSNNPLNVATDISSGTNGLYLRNSAAIKYISYDVTFNSSGQITSMNSTWGDESYSGNTWWGLVDSYLNITSIILATNQENYVYTTPTWTNTSFSIANVTYNYQDNLPLTFLNGPAYHWIPSDIFSEEEQPICNATQVVGMFENPSEFNVTISGTGNVMKENIEGIITISYDANTTYSASDWEIIDTISEFTTGEYKFTCDNQYSKCELKYSYNYEDDIDETITMNFKFKTITNVDMPSFVRLYNCSKNYENINITYNYTKKTTQQDTTDNKIDNIVGGIGNILNFLNPSNLIYIVVPTEKQMQSLLNEMQDSINSKLGILGLPLTIYTRFMNLANTSTQENWCITWDSIKVPNFENSEIIPSGQWCFNTILENQTINNFRNVSIGIIGGLILLSFVQYLNNVYHRVIDSPDRDEYLYITTEDIYDINDDTGEVSNHKLVQKKTRREKQ